MGEASSKVLFGKRMWFGIGWIVTLFFFPSPSPSATHKAWHAIVGRRGLWAALSLTPMPTPPPRTHFTHSTTKSAWRNKRGTQEKISGDMKVIDEDVGGGLNKGYDFISIMSRPDRMEMCSSCLQDWFFDWSPVLIFIFFKCSRDLLITG